MHLGKEREKARETERNWFNSSSKHCCSKFKLFFSQLFPFSAIFIAGLVSSNSNETQCRKLLYHVSSYNGQMFVKANTTLPTWCLNLDGHVLFYGSQSPLILYKEKLTGLICPMQSLGRNLETKYVQHQFIFHDSVTDFKISVWNWAKNKLALLRPIIPISQNEKAELTYQQQQLCKDSLFCKLPDTYIKHNAVWSHLTLACVIPQTKLLKQRLFDIFFKGKSAKCFRGSNNQS